MSMSLIQILNNHGIAVLPTDTIYGLHALATDHVSVQRIYNLKGRDDHKPLIVLISHVNNLKQFGVDLDSELESLLTKIWPNPVSVILPVAGNWDFLHRGSNTLAFRMPNNDFLLTLMKETGPLVSTSVNPQAQLAASTIEEAKNYFGDKVEFYEDAGKLVSEPSTVIKITNGQPEILRQGSFQFKA